MCSPRTRNVSPRFIVTELREFLMKKITRGHIADQTDTGKSIVMNTKLRERQ